MRFLIIWWQARLPRERLLLICLVALVFGGLFQLSWKQALIFRENAQQQLSAEYQAMKMLPELERVLQQRLASRPAIKNKPDVETMNTFVKQYGLMLRLTKQDETWYVRDPARVDFNRLIAFMAMLESQHGLTADKLHLEREKQHVRLTYLELKHVK